MPTTSIAAAYDLLVLLVIIFVCVRFATLLCKMLSMFVLFWSMLSVRVSLLLNMLKFSVMFIGTSFMAFGVFLLAFSAFKASTIVSTCLLDVDED